MREHLLANLGHFSVILVVKYSNSKFCLTKYSSGAEYPVTQNYESCSVEDVQHDH